MIPMLCPKCGYEMAQQSHDTSSDSWSGKPCDRFKYQCSYDKTRVTAEIPQEEKKEETSKT